jgi:hypothetical protein
MEPKAPTEPHPPAGPEYGLTFATFRWLTDIAASPYCGVLEWQPRRAEAVPAKKADHSTDMS